MHSVYIPGQEVCSYITVTCGVIHDNRKQRKAGEAVMGLHCGFNRKLLAAAAHVHKKTELKASGGR